jgi:hypothetical protein
VTDWLVAQGLLSDPEHVETDPGNLRVVRSQLGFHENMKC